MIVNRDTPLQDWLNTHTGATIGDFIDALEDAGYHGGSRHKSFVSKVTESLKQIDEGIMDMLRPWAEVDKAASTYAKTIATAKKGMDELRNTAISSVVKGRIGFDFGMNPAELLEAQTNYAKAVGRSITLGLDDQRNLAAISRIFESPTDFLNDFEKFGLSISSAGEHLGRMYSDAAKSGVSLEKYAKNVQQGLAMAQTYTFRGGLKGMEEMAKRAAMIRMEMSQVQSFAESFSTIEKAIENTARLQVLGGPFATGADALGLLNDSLNGVEDVEKRMEEFTKNMGTFNKATGEVTVSQFNKMRLREYANITGQDYNKVMEVTQRQAMMGEIEAQMGALSNISALDDDLKDLIKNSATFKDGKAGVTIDGKFKELSEVTDKDRDALIAQSRTDSENIQDIAKNVRSLYDLRKGVKSQYEGVQARMTKPLGWAAKGATGVFTALGGLSNFILNIAVITKLLGIGGDRLKTIKNIWERGGGGSMSVGDQEKIRRQIFKRGTATGKATEQGAKAAANTAKAAKTANSLRKTKQVINLVKAGKGAKVLATGLKAAGKKIPIAGALLSAGIEAFSNKEQFKERATRGSAVGKTAGAGVGAALGAGIGSVIGPVGIVVGGIVGEFLGKTIGGVVGKIHDKRVTKNQTMVDSQLAKAGVQRQGDYSVSRLKEIDKALQTGRMTNDLRKKLLKEGDVDIVNQINAVKDNKRKERQERRDKRREERAEEIRQRFGTAKFEIEKAYFGGKGILGKQDKGVTILKGKKEDGNSKELTNFRNVINRETASRIEKPEKREIGPIDININGTLKLEGENGQSIDLVSEMRKNPQLLNQVTEMVMRKINERMNGGVYLEDRHNGDNMYKQA